ncbi:MAG: A/G-specific adenine glycosylase [Saprospiraceae bacterium]
MYKFSSKQKSFFRTELLNWSKAFPRALPWVGEKDPYLIWLSEIILQQTRVQQGMPYFEKFKQKYPTVKDLANTPEDDLMKSWEGLGYYSRARNLHFSAKLIANERNGVFPTCYEDIRALKGVGDYTAAAIASFAFDLPYAVVDGNVYRVLSRFFGITDPIDVNKSKKQFAALAQELLADAPPASYNQAIMDFGAVQCTPKSPSCTTCPLQKNCQASQKNMVKNLPVKSKKIVKKTRYFNYLVLNIGTDVLISKREQRDIWRNLYEFLLLETDAMKTQEELVTLASWKTLFPDTSPEINRVSKPFKQQLTHQTIIAQFWEITLNESSFSKIIGYIRINRENLSNFAFPKLFDWYLQDNSLYLDL